MTRVPGKSGSPASQTGRGRCLNGLTSGRSFSRGLVYKKDEPPPHTQTPHHRYPPELQLGLPDRVLLRYDTLAILPSPKSVSSVVHLHRLREG